MSHHDCLISVCICTFRRPELLDALLKTLTYNVEYPGISEILVVDNDASKSAQNIVKNYENSFQSIRYFSEPIQNIARARNRCVLEANGKWIAMIDDDEIPSKMWLTNLFSGAKDGEVDAVFGPVVSIYPEGAPRWVVEGRYLDKRRFPTGSVVPRGETRTSNVLIKRDLISNRQGPFDLQFGLTGGEDSRLFDQLVIEGKKFFWRDDAEVMEKIPPCRATVRWLIRRNFRTGQTYGRIFLLGFGLKRPNFFKMLVFFLRSFVLAFSAVPMFLVNLPFGRKFAFKWIIVAVTQLGKMSAFSSRVFEEYADS